MSLLFFILRFVAFIYPLIIGIMIVGNGFVVTANPVFFEVYFLVGVLVLLFLKLLDFSIGLWGVSASKNKISIVECPEGSAGLWPLVSVIVPAYNEAKVIAGVVEQILRSDYPNLEVLVVDDGSADETSKVVKEQFPQVRLIAQKNSGKAAALNRGLLEANGQFTCFVDADSLIATTSIRMAVLYLLKQSDIAGVSGAILVGNRKSWLGQFQNIEYISALNLSKTGMALLSSVPVISGVFGLFRSEIIRQIGGVPEDTLVEDADLSMTLLMKNFATGFCGEIIAFTEVPETFHDLSKQRYRWARGFNQVSNKQAQLPKKNIFQWAALIFFQAHYILRSNLLGAFSIVVVLYGVLGSWSYLLFYWLLQSLLVGLSYLVGLRQFPVEIRARQSLSVRALLLYFWYSLFLDMVNILGSVNEVFKVNTSWRKLTRRGFTLEEASE